MGNTAILSVLGLMVFLGVIMTTLDKIDVTSTQFTAAYSRTGSAENIARSALGFARLNIDTSTTLPSSSTISGNLEGGSYTVTTTTIGDTIKINVVGRYDTTTYPMSATLLRTTQMSIFPDKAFETAFRVRTTPITYVMRYLSVLIDGRDHDTVGVLTGVTADNVPAVMVLNKADSSRVDSGTTNPSTMLLGSQQIIVDSVITSSENFVDTIITLADYKYITPTYSGITISKKTWGSSENPVIVYLQGNDTYNLTISSNSTGWGICVAKGKIKFGTGVRWNGLMIVNGNCVLNFSTSTTYPKSVILGGLYLASTGSTSFRIQNNGQVWFSEKMLMKVKDMKKLTKYSQSGGTKVLN